VSVEGLAELRQPFRGVVVEQPDVAAPGEERAQQKLVGVTAAARSPGPGGGRSPVGGADPLEAAPVSQTDLEDATDVVRWE
jgi:hypothetical protein